MGVYLKTTPLSCVFQNIIGTFYLSLIFIADIGIESEAFS